MEYSNIEVRLAGSPIEPKPMVVKKPTEGQQLSSIDSIEDNRVRFSDEELKKFKELIVSKLDNAKMEYNFLKSTLSLRDDNGTNDTSPTFKLLEDAGDVLSKEETAQLAIRQEKLIQHLHNALIRIENKTYGTCRITGKLIPKERLRSVPHATMSIDAKRHFPGFAI